MAARSREMAARSAAEPAFIPFGQSLPIGGFANSGTRGSEVQSLSEALPLRNSLDKHR